MGLLLLQHYIHGYFMTSEICHLTIDDENLKDFIVDTVIHLITGGEVKKDTKLPVKRNNAN